MTYWVSDGSGFKQLLGRENVCSVGANFANFDDLIWERRGNVAGVRDEGRRLRQVLQCLSATGWRPTTEALQHVGLRVGTGHQNSRKPRNAVLELMYGPWEPTVYQHAFFQNGAFLQSLMETWLAGQGREFFLQTLADHPFDDGTWDAVETADRFGQVVVPAVHYGGWYDIFTQGTIDAFVGYHAAWRSSVANKPNGCRDV